MSATEYRIHGIAVDSIAGSDGQIVAYLKVGKRDRLEPAPLTRREAWALVDALLRAIRSTEQSP